jgi:hypothetical protein
MLSGSKGYSLIQSLDTLVLAESLPRDPPQHYKTAHGFLMAISFGILFPLGAILVRSGRISVHGPWQILTYTAVLAGFGIGVWMATIMKFVGTKHDL